MLGDKGESLACDWYIRNGYKVVGRNINISRVGEIDLIVVRSVRNSVEYVFSEVKTRRGTSSGFGYESVNYAKRVRMRTCASIWMSENLRPAKRRALWRLDVVSIDLCASPVSIKVFENITMFD